MRIRVLVVVGILALGGLTPRSAEAAPVLGAQLFANGGNVIATFLGSNASFNSELYLFGANNLLTPITGPIFNNHTTPAGTSVNLGSFAAGTELVFAIRVLNTGNLFFMGPANRNSDGVLHAAVDFAPPAVVPVPPFTPIPAGAAAVGFEDILGGGDRDYNDLVFAFSNVRATVPEPGSLLGLSGAMIAGVLTRFRKRGPRS